MAAQDLKLTEAHDGLHEAAVRGERVRVRGRVLAVGDSRSGAYRNRWLKIAVGSLSVRVTATPSSQLGSMAAGSTIELAVRLTGMVDLTEDVYYGERAQLLSWTPPA